MATDKKILVKGVKYLLVTLFFMLSAPIVIYEAFKNQGHPWYWPVLVVGVVLAFTAIGMGVYGIKTIVFALFGPKSKT